MTDCEHCLWGRGLGARDYGCANRERMKRIITLLLILTLLAPMECQAAQKKHWTNSDARDIARVIYLEARGIKSQTEKACIAWAILNRVDATGKSIHDVIRQPYQFAFSPNAPVKKKLLKLAKDVLRRWNREKNGKKKVGRVLGKKYMWYHGDGKHNYFHNAYSPPYRIWKYKYKSPYKN